MQSGASSNRYVPPSINDFFDRLLLSCKETLHDVVCRQFRYCHKRHEGHLECDGVNLSIAIADGLIMAATKLPIPPTYLSVYVVKQQMLNRFCECQEMNETAEEAPAD